MKDCPLAGFLKDTPATFGLSLTDKNSLEVGAESTVRA